MIDNIELICAGTDLGVHIDGTDKGPEEICRHIKKIRPENKFTVNKENIIKEKSHDNLRKNFDSIKEYNKDLYNKVNETFLRKHFPIVIGGDHTVAVSSALASFNNNGEIGILWIDAHADFNTFETTETGNIHGVPLASICGLCDDLTNNIANKYVSPKKCIIIGARSIDINELKNLENNNIRYYTTKELQNESISKIMDKVFSLLPQKIHISYDLDIIDPSICMGVSVPEANGINQNEAMEIMDYLVKNKQRIVSLDLVEYNPTLDNNNQTRDIAISLLKKFING